MPNQRVKKIVMVKIQKTLSGKINGKLGDQTLSENFVVSKTQQL